MTSPRWPTGKITSVLLALGVSITLAGCGRSAEQGTTSPATQPPPQSSSTSAAPAAAYDISRVDNIKSDIPPGFAVESHPAKTLDQQDIDSSDVTILTNAVVDPPQCRSLLIPPYTDPSAGTRAAGVRAEGDKGSIVVVALGLPKPVPATAPPPGCDHASVSGGPEETGTAESIPAPKIDAATTTGVKLIASQEEDPDYIFTAALNEQTSIVVLGSTDSELDPQRLLSDLLVKAAAAVRGQ
jgi:hypothetical protein